MYDSLLRFMRVPPEGDEAALVRSLFVPHSFRKGQFFQRAGHVAARGAFVVRGCFRTYTIDEEGREQILGFSQEDGWIGDLHSATSGTPTEYFVEALESSEVLTIDLPSFERMLASSRLLADAFRKSLQRSQAAKERRILFVLHSSAEERYSEFVRRRPGLAHRVPLHMLASYLGMTPETLSRIRSRQKGREQAP